ncbi:MAG TPA: alkaline phosphatase family protein [Gemmatimonadaceae bacterium]|nr:alkaline phosphatase family protein [Gemmatimonadaceae bacterium]
MLTFPLRIRAALSFVFLLSAARAVPVSAQRRSELPPIRHVFVIVLENQGFDTTFNPQSAAPYLADTLRLAGAFLRQYHGIAHYSLGNYLAMIAGVPPTPKIQIDCPSFDDFVQTGVARDGQLIGDGCVYPTSVKTIANQLEAKRLTWGGFMEDMGKDPARDSATCSHPVIGTPDPTEGATPNDQYATKHNPFVYFHAIIDRPSCKQRVVPLTQLEDALSSLNSTPNYTFIVPNLCHDGHDRPCVNGEPGGLTSANEFLRHWVPIIIRSPAYQKDGLIVITFDEALSIDASACCNQPSGPNTPKPGVNGPGGGRTGAVLLSRFIKPGTVSDVPYNHYSFLRSVEDLFDLPHLGYAARAGLVAFGKDVYTTYPR